MLDQEFFVSNTDDQGRRRPALRTTVPLRLLRLMGLLTGETGGRDDEMRGTRIPLRIVREVREGCQYTAEFGSVEESEWFPVPVQLVTIPCRSPAGEGRCARTGEERPCTLFGVVASLETPEKERVSIIVAPILPGATLTLSERELLLKKRELYAKSLRLWEDALAPINLLMDATTRGVQFWVRSWFGK
ncbi:MAG: hypothetical protein HQM02_07610 [Magnetococcales bacterium]|nr:hypothetical protein [Magnetococcales bacterium]